MSFFCCRRWRYLWVVSSSLVAVFVLLVIVQRSQLVFVNQHKSQTKVVSVGRHRSKINYCESLFEGSLQPPASNISMVSEKARPNDSELLNLIASCSAFQTTLGYINDSSTEEKQFPIAFSIKMHKSGGQAEQLLRTIYRPHNTYCIHIDKRSAAEVHLLFEAIAGCFRNIFLVTEPMAIRYATQDHIEAELKLMELCRRFGNKWKYYINLTGQEFPLKTNYEIVLILKTLNGSNDIESYPFPRKLFITRMRGAGNITFNHGVKVYKGGAYGTFSRAFVDYILDNEKARMIISFFSSTVSPEEAVWATLNRLSDAPGSTIRDIRHSRGEHISKAVIWRWDGLKCHGQYLRSVCIFSMWDLMWLRSRPELFANKFDTDFDQVALDCMEEEIRNRTVDPRPNFLNFHYYRNLPQSKPVKKQSRHKNL